MTLSFDTLTHLWLEIAPETQRACWRQSQTLSTPAGRWNAYLHQLCLTTFLQWCQDDGKGAISAEPTTTPELWEFFSGLAVSLESKRLILVPSDAIDIQELRVPQEWVDVPAWAGDYYLAVQVNPDEGWLRIWGYTTHQTLKGKAQFDDGDRTYTLDNDALISDLNVLWVVQHLNQAEVTRSQLTPLPLLALDQLTPLLDPPNQGAVSNLRTVLPFQQWAAFLTDPQQRSQLFSRLRERATGFMPPDLEISSLPQAIATPVLTHLSQWFQNIFQPGWLSLDQVLETNSTLSYSFRKDAVAGEMRRIKLLSLHNPQDTDPSAPGSSAVPSVALLLSLNREDDGRVEVRAQIRPAPGDTHLPANLVLELLTVAEQPLQTVRARHHDNYIQLKRFKCLPGWHFTLKIEFNGVQIREDFVS
jgi:Protein of unknown function (DUF1822)